VVLDPILYGPAAAGPTHLRRATRSAGGRLLLYKLYKIKYLIHNVKARKIRAYIYPILLIISMTGIAFFKNFYYSNVAFESMECNFVVC
jgi:hypothetical protein